jgi:glycosyltransferase involved in cell wall biosynthesis
MTPLAQKKIVVVTPVFNEEENILLFFDELLRVLNTLPYAREVIAVDDGSARKTAEILDGLCDRHPEIGVLHLTRNFGHQAALTAGLDHAEGDAVILMDSDLEHPPALIPAMVEAWEGGADIVYAVREEAPEWSVFKRASSQLFYKMLNLFSEIPVPERAADFRLLSRDAADAMRSLRERTRFLRGLSTWIGYQQTAISYKPGRRSHGRSKFDLRKMVNLGADGLISMSSIPLRLSLFLGMAISIGSLAFMIYTFVRFFTHHTVPGWSSLIVTVLFLGGIQLNVLGLIGLYIANIYSEVKQRPLYLVRRRRGRVASAEATSASAAGREEESLRRTE